MAFDGEAVVRKRRIVEVCVAVGFSGFFYSAAINWTASESE
jgi:hypothetical protein